MFIRCGHNSTITIWGLIFWITFSKETINNLTLIAIEYYKIRTLETSFCDSSLKWAVPITYTSAPREVFSTVTVVGNSKSSFVSTSSLFVAILLPACKNEWNYHLIQLKSTFEHALSISSIEKSLSSLVKLSGSLSTVVLLSSTNHWKITRNNYNVTTFIVPVLSSGQVRVNNESSLLEGGWFLLDSTELEDASPLFSFWIKLTESTFNLGLWLFAWSISSFCSPLCSDNSISSDLSAKHP